VPHALEKEARVGAVPAHEQPHGPCKGLQIRPAPDRSVAVVWVGLPAAPKYGLVVCQPSIDGSVGQVVNLSGTG
jgi:hypothetical protein